jgi:hypothetical protein
MELAGVLSKVTGLADESFRQDDGKKRERLPNAFRSPAGDSGREPGFHQARAFRPLAGPGKGSESDPIHWRARTMAKWWHERAKPGSAAYRKLLRGLARVNATATIRIETVEPISEASSAEDGRSPGSESVDQRFVDEEHQAQYERFLNEEHHRQYGSRSRPTSPWAFGKCVFSSVVSAGLLPHHRLLDFACGALRLGHWAIPYLDEGNYFGVDAHLPSLEAAATYEIPLYDLERKRPRLLWNENLALSHFGTTFDWVLDFHGSRRLKPKSLRSEAYARFAEVLGAGGRLLTCPQPAVPIDTFAELGLAFSRQWMTDDCALLPVSFKSRIRWWEFVRE